MLFILLLPAMRFCTALAAEEEQVKPEKEEEVTVKKSSPQPPHIIFILADDLGWNDVSFHGSPQIRTPNIDALASSSLILNNYYTESDCTPARASLMSGKYPIRIGLQHSVIKSGEPISLPADIVTMPEILKNKGYVNHMVGKWHLGYAKKEFTPTSRGFDSFFGFYTGQIDYYDYTSYETSKNSAVRAFYGVDLQDGTTPIKSFRGQYATDVFTRKAVEIIENHNASNPLFLYLAHLACHSGNEYLPVQAPLSLIAKNAHIKDPKRRSYAGIISALDDSVGKVFDALNRKQLLQNTIIVFTSDNGGDAKSSNWPFRGQKTYSWEGAIRVPAFIWSPLLGLSEPRTATQLMHVSDWLPTLYAAAGGEETDLGSVDGYNVWKAIIKNLPSPRVEVLHNIDPISGMSALRRGDYKLISGTALGGNDFWYGPSGFEDFEQLPQSMDEWVFKNESTVKGILENIGMWLPKSPDTWRINASVQCSQPSPSDNGDCDPNKEPCLFNIAADPCEYINLAARYPRIVRSMIAILNAYNVTAIQPLSTSRDPRGDPRCHGFAHVPWLDEQYASDCPYY